LSDDDRDPCQRLRKRECPEIVRDKDVGTLQYDTSFNDDESDCIVLERFRDSDALILHGQNMAPLMESIMATGTVSGELLGDLSEGLRAQMADSPVGLFTRYQALWQPYATNCADSAAATRGPRTVGVCTSSTPR
jgi:hypothetical protein